MAENKEDLQADVKQEETPVQDEQATEVEAQESEATETQTEAEIDPKEQEIADLKQALEEMTDKYYRAEAEMANMTKRMKKEQEQILKYQGQDLIKEILPSLDNLNRALEIEVDDEASVQLKKGVEMVASGVENALKNHHVEKIASLGEKFDPTKHQAVQSVPVEDGQEADTIVQVFQDGYMLKDRVLRPAMVVVAQ